VYVPKHFAEDDPATLRAYIEANPFATVVSMLDGKLIATHVPVLLDGEAEPGGMLLGHVAKANPHWRDLRPARLQPRIGAGGLPYKHGAGHRGVRAADLTRRGKGEAKPEPAG
jgi:hypothetical protein